MKDKKLWSIFIQLLLVYMATNILFLMIFGSRHPLITSIQEWPMYGQILITIPISVLFYIVPGYLFVVGKKYEMDIQKYYPIAVIGIILINLLLFVVCHLIATASFEKGIWIIYSFINPTFGSLMYDVSETNVSWFWIVSVLFAPTGLGIGIYLRLRRLRRLYS